MRPKFLSQIAQRFAAPARKHRGLLGIAASHSNRVDSGW
jgi:hypothetical protein